jgi:hypothetical protein
MRITDTLAMTRSLNEFRHLDQQERALAERIAAQVVEKDLLELKKDVEEPDHAVADRSDESGGTEYHGHHREKKEEKEEPPAPPEVLEGHILDLKA